MEQCQQDTRLQLINCQLCGLRVSSVHLFRRMACLPGAGEDEFVPDGGDGTPENPIQMAMMCDSCSDEVMSELASTYADDLPITHPDAVRDCITCGSSILHGEALFLVSYASVNTLHVRGKQRVVFEFHDGEEEEAVICVTCMGVISAEILEGQDGDPLADSSWPDLNTTQDGECHRCTEQRCWREATCQCRCHG